MGRAQLEATELFWKTDILFLDVTGSRFFTSLVCRRSVQFNVRCLPLLVFFEVLEEERAVLVAQEGLMPLLAGCAYADR